MKIEIKIKEPLNYAHSDTSPGIEIVFGNIDFYYLYIHSRDTVYVFWDENDVSQWFRDKPMRKIMKYVIDQDKLFKKHHMIF